MNGAENTAVERLMIDTETDLEELLEHHYDLAYRFARHHCNADDVDDAVQQAFVGILKSRRPFAGRARFSSYLFAVLRNTCRHFWRSARRRARRATRLEASSVEPNRYGNPAELAERNFAVHVVEQALARLSPEHRQILLLREILGLSGPATATHLGLTLPAMKSHLHRARQALRDALT